MRIVEFLEARIEEDEAVAREAVAPDRPGAHWEWEAPNDDGDPESPLWLRTVEEFPTTSGVGDLPGFPLGSECMAAPSVAMAHIARHDPARILADVEAKRGVIKEIEEARASIEERGLNVPSFLTWILMRLAKPYADHPDYKPDWNI